MAGLADKLAEPYVNSPANNYDPARRTRTPAPKGFEPGVRYESDGSQVVTTPAMSHLATEDEWADAVASLGVTVPDGWRLRLVEARFDPAAWTRQAQGEDAVTQPVWRYKFAVEEIPTTTGENLDDLTKRILKAKPRKRPKRTGEPATQTLMVSDWQLAKTVPGEDGGIEGTIRRIKESWAAALDMQSTWRREGYDVNDLVVIGNGDIVEGCAIYPHQMMEISGDMRDQRNMGRRLLVDGFRQLAPHFDTVRVSAVGGNHGENRIDGKKINRHDNSDAELFEQVADVLAANPDAFGHVTFQIPRDALAATIDVRGWVYCHQHGHIAGRGGNPEQKIRGWLQAQALAKTPAGDAHVALTSHMHHPRMADWGADDRTRSGCLWIQNQALDGGSPQFSDAFGTESAPGITTLLATAERRAVDVRVIPL